MIVATKTVDSLLRGIVIASNLNMSNVESIAKAIQLDPSISNPTKEMFIVSSDDMKNPKIRTMFDQAVRAKHPKSLVMYINKTGRDMPGIDPDMFDSYISKPKREDIIRAFQDLVQESSAKAKFDVNDNIEIPADFNISPGVLGDTRETVPTEVETPVVHLDFEPTAPKETPRSEDSDINLLSRINECEGWAALAAVSKEISASRIVHEITEANASYRQSETYVTALSENILAIMSNPEYDTATKLVKVRSILHDRAYIKAKTNSIVEQSVEKIIMSVVDKAKQEVEAKTREYDERIIKALQSRGSEEAPNVRLSTIIEKRSKTLIELTALDLELKGIAATCIDTVNGTIDSVVSDSVATTESPILDSQMKARYGEIVPENILTVLDNLFKTGHDSSEEFGKMSLLVNSSIKKLCSLLAYYQEESEVLADTIRFMKANSVEDTVVANTIMKKATRMFVNAGDFDSVALTYMVSKHSSRKTTNVMLLDLSGTDMFGMFGVPTKKYSEFMEHDYFDGKLLVVSTANDPGTVVKSDEDCQRLMTRLIHYAKHFSTINIMCTAEQSNVISNFMADVRSITYMVDCFPTTIKRMATCIADSKMDNTGSRVVLVNYVSDSAGICKDLGIMEEYDMQLVTCPPVPEIRACSLHKQDPYDVESIVEDCGGVLRVC